MTFSQPFAQFIARLVGLALLFAPACGESVGPHYETGCKTSTVTLTVSPGVVPQFNWTPNCGVWSLQVTNVTEHTMWSTGTVLRNELLSPVTYGIHPAGADQNTMVAMPLQPGVTYEVKVHVMSDALESRTAGQKSFTP